MRALKTLLPLWLFGALLWPFLAVGAEDVIPLRIVGNGDASPSGGVFQDVYEGDIDSGRVVFRGGFDDAGNWGS